MSSSVLAVGAKLCRKLFFAGLLFVLSPWASPPLALALGLALGLTVSKNLHQVLKAGRSGFVYTALGISFALGVGLLLAVKPTAGFLISTGTAICGGSAIAAVGPVAGATEGEMSVALGTVFILNSVALLTFPWIGAALRLSQTQFGLWAALAFHDTSSVVGAAASTGRQPSR